MTDRHYVTFKELIWDRQVPAAVLATAVERHGVFCWDRFGRFVKVEAEYEAGYHRALDLIAQACDPDPEKGVDCVDFEDERGYNVLDGYGWPYDQVPDFEKIAAVDPLVTRRRPPAFVSVNDVLVNRKAPPGEVAAWIEAHGIWAFNDFQSLELNGPQSRAAQQVLAGISYRVHSDTMPIDPDFEAWYMDQDPTYSHGWPGDSVPRFGKQDIAEWQLAHARLEVRKSFFTSELRTLGRLLVLQEARPGDIASSIEKEGVHGFDDYGRVVLYPPPTTQAGEALRALKRFNDLSHRGATTPDLLVLDDAAFSRYGWLPQGFQPDTVPARADPVVATSEPAAVIAPIAEDPQIGNRKSSYDALVLGLLCFIRGEITGTAHPDWKAPHGQNDLIRQIREKVPRLRGLRETNMRKMFAEANKLRPEANLPRLNQAQEEAGNEPPNQDDPLA